MRWFSDNSLYFASIFRLNISQYGNMFSTFKLHDMTWNEDQMETLLFWKRVLCKREETVVRGENPGLIAEYHLLETQTIRSCVLSKLFCWTIWSLQKKDDKFCKIESLPVRQSITTLALTLALLLIDRSGLSCVSQLCKCVLFRNKSENCFLDFSFTSTEFPK